MQSKLLITGLAALALLCAAHAAPKMDANGDGNITKEKPAIFLRMEKLPNACLDIKNP